MSSLSFRVQKIKWTFGCLHYPSCPGCMLSEWLCHWAQLCISNTSSVATMLLERPVTSGVLPETQWNLMKSIIVLKHPDLLPKELLCIILNSRLEWQLLLGLKLVCGRMASQFSLWGWHVSSCSSLWELWLTRLFSCPELGIDPWTGLNINGAT